MCNDIKTINAELDFYFPLLNFAIELNGVVHYKPIFGTKKFDSIQKNDANKLILCYKNKIDLMIVSDVTSLAKNFEKIWSEIEIAIDNKIN